MKNRPFTSFAVFGSMRSGSNLLEKFLNQYEGIFCHGELFNPVLIRKNPWDSYLGVTRKQQLENPELMVAALLNAGDRKIPGYRIFQTHNQWAIDNALADPLCAKIVLTRDPVDSFVSLEIARKTDQWLISDTAHRKPAKILLDLEKFSEYAKARSAYYTKISTSLALSGQPGFELDYAMLNDVDTINRLAAFLGVDEQKTTLAAPIKRQNPEALADKILNYSEVCQALGLPKSAASTPLAPKPARVVGTDLSRIYFCAEQPLAFAPVPSVPDAGIRRWLAAHDGDAPEHGYTARGFSQWLAARPRALFFSVVQHPLTRAYDAYMKKVFPTGAGGYTEIRHQLERDFGLLLPQPETTKEITPDHPRDALNTTGYGVETHRIGFKQFLAFVAGNLAGQTDIRQDGKWQAQVEIIRRYRVLQPRVHVFRFETLRTDLAYLENRLGLAPCFASIDPPENRFSFALSEIYDPEIETLAQAAYAQDYREFGYKPLNG